jgi:protein-glutamine gamma-glutamyltransferase
MIFMGVFTLYIAGGIGLTLLLALLAIFLVSWAIEDKSYQLSERAGLVAVLISLPLFYLDWKFEPFGSMVVNDRIGVIALTHLILFLSVVKILQQKASRDWLFLYLISFFEVLLAAGLSISPQFLGAFTVYIFFGVTSIISFEIKKSTGQFAPSNPSLTLIEKNSSRRNLKGGTRHLVYISVCLFFFILALSFPIFFAIPRYAESGLAYAGSGVTGMVGFSDRVKLGLFGELQQSDRVVMRVRVEGPSQPKDLYWRGVALDYFNGVEWHRSSRTLSRPTIKPHGLIQIGTTESLHRLTSQTFFIEPMDTNVIFAAPRVVGLQGFLPNLRVDSEGGLVTHFHTNERLTYRVYSDTDEPDIDLLRADKSPYKTEFHKYLQLPTIDARIFELSLRLTQTSDNRYDKARSIENYLRTQYKYSLEMKSGGEDPLSDFLFNKRVGHCEYFSTAMALMLRIQGIASRVVNGFQTGEYNDAANAYTVRQRYAHSWVEVYFPESESWVTFDPTPPADNYMPKTGGGIVALLKKYSEALELIWIQYVVTYDRDEQRTLASGLSEGLHSYGVIAIEGAEGLRAETGRWLKILLIKGRDLLVFVTLIPLALILLFFIKILFKRRERKNGSDKQKVLYFYSRMLKALEKNGLKPEKGQTPVEFAKGVANHEVEKITEIYNHVRYGTRELSNSDIDLIEEYLKRIEARQFSAI